MADITYPSGVNSWGLLIDGETLTDTPSDTEGTIELGDANPVNEAGSNGIIFDIDYTSGSEATLNVRFAASRDSGTTWFTLPQHDQDMATPADVTWRKRIGPLSGLETTIRVQVDVTTPGSTPGSISVRARLDGVTNVITRS